jgi:hypothetical protein
MNKDHKKLQTLLLSLGKTPHADTLWSDLDTFLRDYLRVESYPESSYPQEAFNNLLLKMYEHPEYFSIEGDDTNFLYKKIGYIRTAFRNFMLKEKRKDVREEIKSLKYKREHTGLDDYNEQRLEHLKAILENL